MHTKFYLENLKGRSLERTRCSCEYNIKMDLREIGCGDTDWIHLTQEAVMSSCKQRNETSGSLKAGRISGSAERLLAFQGGLCSMYLIQIRIIFYYQSVGILYF
jgi:hypothetical protein